MAASIAKLAPPDLVKQAIIDLSERGKLGSSTQTSTADPDAQPTSDSKIHARPLSPLSVTNGSVSTGDLVECRQWLQRWLDAIVVQTIPKFLRIPGLSLNRIQELVPSLGFSTRLACAIHYHCPSLPGTEPKQFEVCLDRCRAALLDGRTNLTAALSEDELTNGRNVHRLLRRQLISTNHCPIRSFHLLEQLCLDPCMRSLTPAQEVRLSAEFYHWLTNPVETSSSLAQDSSSEPFVVKPAIPDSAPSSSSLQNGILRDLVRSSGIVARPARPAHPNSRPIALLNTSTVEQLVVSSSSDAVSKLPDTVVREAETTSETPESNPPGVANSSFLSLSMTAERELTDPLLVDLARVASNATAAASVAADSQQHGRSSLVTDNLRPSGGFFVSPQNRSADSDLTSTTIPVDSSPLTRNKFYATFSKRPTPSLSDKLPVIGSPTRKHNPATVCARSGTFARSTNFSSPQHAPVSALDSGIPSLRSEFEKKRRSRSTVSANQSVGSDFSAGQKIDHLPQGITTWASTGGTRQAARKGSSVDSTTDGMISSTVDAAGSKLPISRSATAALRLSLDQRRRAIEVGRQRTMLANHQAAKQRHHAAFQKLLQTEQRRRSKKEELEASEMDSALQTSRASVDQVISSSALESADGDKQDRMNASEPYDVDQSAVSISQREQVTDVDEDFSMHSAGVAGEGISDHLLLPDQTTSQNSEVTTDRISAPETEQDLSLIDVAITPDKPVPSSTKEASPLMFESIPAKQKSDEASLSESHVPTKTRSSTSSQQQQEPDHSGSEAMEYIGSIASERPMRSVSPSSRDWYNSMPIRHRSKGDPLATNATRQRYSGHSKRPVEDLRHSVDPAVIKTKGSNHSGRSIQQRRTTGLPMNQSPRMLRQRQFQHSSGGSTGGRRYELTSQSLCVEPRTRTERSHQQLIAQQQRLRAPRCGFPHPLAASEDYNWTVGMTRPVEWDEPGDDEYDDEVDDEAYDDDQEDRDEEIQTNGSEIQGYSVIDDEYYDEQDTDGDYDNRSIKQRQGRMVYDGRRSSMTDSEEEENAGGGASNLRRSGSHRLWRDVERFSERSSAVFSSGRRTTHGGYRKRNQLRASYDPNTSSYGSGLRPTETVVDAETLDKLNRNLLDLQSGLERLSAQQQQVLLASSSATAAVALVAGANTQQAFLNQQPVGGPSGGIANQPLQPPPITVQPSSPAGFTRAMWIERPQFREVSRGQLDLAQAAITSEGQVGMVPEENTSVVAATYSNARSESSEPSSQSQPNQNSEICSIAAKRGQIFMADLNTHQGSPSPTEPKAPEAPELEPTPPPAADKSTEPANKSPTSKVFFIGFDEPDPQLMQRKCDRLEARRAAEKAMAAQHLEALRSSGREEKQSQELAELERRTTEKERREAILQAYLNRKEQMESQCHRHQNPYPVRPGSAALSLSSGNLSTKSRRSASQNTLSKTNQRSVDLRASRADALRAKSATRKQPPMDSSTASVRGNADGEAVDSTEADIEAKQEKRVNREIPQKQRQKPNGRPASRLTSGLSLSSLHRLGASDQSTSGPGVSVAGQPKLFVKPKAKSNRMVIVNAIGHCCLAGAVNEPMKQATLKELASTEGTHFMILFRDARCQYRAVYAYDLESEELHLICGTGPRKITHDMANRFFKYNSGGKQFIEITSTNHLSPVVDAITIHDYLWSKSGAQSAAMSLVSGRPAS